MNAHFQASIRRVTGAAEISQITTIQTLWSGYGKIVRCELIGGEFKSVIAKHVLLPKDSAHPRGWNTDLSHLRKIKSYEVEQVWYNKYSRYCSESCRVPKCLTIDNFNDEVLIVLEDLNDSGYPERITNASLDDIKACLAWLASLHATFMHKKPEGLWDVGTYWHLETRPDELNALSDKKLKAAASAIDSVLKDSPYQTIVHGDAKLANFCFSADGKTVAAVDFQYVGGGCGMKDVAYFIGSCLYEDECEKYESELLDFYFNALKNYLEKQNNIFNAQDIEHNWRILFPYAWTDFHRFLKGWSPEHWKINSYSERLSQLVVNELVDIN